MGASITENLRDLEAKYLEKESILHYFHKNESATKEVKNLLENDRKSIIRQDSHSGNIFENCRVLETNIAICDVEISYYEKVLGLKNKFKP